MCNIQCKGKNAAPAHGHRLQPERNDFRVVLQPT
jgi:hypothetical protein